MAGLTGDGLLEFHARLVTDAIEQDHGDLIGWRACLCGSPPMVEAATVVARHKGVAAEHVHADAFYTQGN